MALFKTCVGYSYELRLSLKLGYIFAAAVAHTGFKTAHHLEDCVGECSLIRNSALNSLGNKLLVVLLEISVLRAVVHGGYTAHSAVNLESSALINFAVSGGLLTACDKRAYHNRRSTCGDSLDYFARILDAAVGNY